MDRMAHRKRVRTRVASRQRTAPGQVAPGGRYSRVPDMQLFEGRPFKFTSSGYCKSRGIWDQAMAKEERVRGTHNFSLCVLNLSEYCTMWRTVVSKRKAWILTNASQMHLLRPLKWLCFPIAQIPLRYLIRTHDTHNGTLHQVISSFTIWMQNAKRIKK